MESNSRATATRILSKRQRTAPGGLVQVACRSPLGDLFLGLPVELQTEVFLQAVPPLSLIVPGNPCIVISHVCKAWRALALSVPQLWTSFAFDLPRDNEISTDRRIRSISLLKLWLQRSRSCVLDFRIMQDPAHRGPRQPEHGAILLMVLLSHSRRWRNAELSIWDDNIAAAMNDHETGFPLLRSLSLRTEISKTMHPFYFRSSSIPWKQITELHLVNYRLPPSMKQVIRILSQAMNVQSCTVNMTCDVIERIGGQITLPSLSQLHIIVQIGDGSPYGTSSVETDVGNCVSFLESLSLAALRGLRLEWQMYSAESALRTTSITSERLVSFCKGIGSTLEQFSLTYLPISDHTLLQCLACLPLVTELELKYPLGLRPYNPFTDYLLCGLTLPKSTHFEDSNVGVLPRLRTAKFENRGDCFNPESVITFLQSRMDDKHCAQSRLEFLELFTAVPVFEQLPRRLDEWKDRLDISNLLIW
ncbi:hypothetical protein AX17_004871 [Amanita inopinata Kibby_2008]|nr:hypothetical protein AX17_004871 [Amanita inopinata Kibby_2008]